MREHAMKFLSDGDGKTTFGWEDYRRIHKQVGKTYSVQVRIIDLQTGKVEKPSVVTIAWNRRPDDRGNAANTGGSKGNSADK